MTEMTIDDQTFRYDPEATGAIYARLRAGWAEDCGCVGCRNLLAQRDEVYPSAFRELLQQLGIDPNKEAEAVAGGPLENGLHHYGGWFFFVGEMVTAGDSISVVSESPYFGYFITRGGPCPNALSFLYAKAETGQTEGADSHERWARIFVPGALR